MLRIFVNSTRETKFLEKNLNKPIFKKKKFLFYALNKLNNNFFKNFTKYKQNTYMVLINALDEKKFKKFTNLFLQKKINGYLIILPKFNKKFGKIKIYHFLLGKKNKFSFFIYNSYKKTLLQRVFAFRNFYPYETNSTPYSPDHFKEYLNTPEILVKDDVLLNLIQFLFKNKKFLFFKIKLLNLYYVFKFFPELRFLNQIIYKPISFLKRTKSISFRILSVFSMIFFLYSFPRLIYKFSTRHVFPSNNNKFKLNKKVLNNSILVDTKYLSKIKKLKEANIILRGESLRQIKIIDKNLPTFILSCVNPNELEFISNHLDKKIIKKSIFVYPSLNYLKKFIYLNYLSKMKMGNSRDKYKTLMIDGNETKYFSNAKEKIMLKNEKFCKNNNIIYLRAFKNFFPKKPFNSDYIPSGSGLTGIFVIKAFVKKVNIYGWDFHLKFNPKKFSSSFLFLLKSINSNLEFRSNNYLEGLLINLYFAAKFSENKNFKIFGNLDNLNKHKKLIKRIEKVLYK